jgi:hypothetical protein
LNDGIIKIIQPIKYESLLNDINFQSQQSLISQSFQSLQTIKEVEKNEKISEISNRNLSIYNGLASIKVVAIN